MRQLRLRRWRPRQESSPRAVAEENPAEGPQVTVKLDRVQNRVLERRQVQLRPGGALSSSPALKGSDVDLFAVFALKQRDFAGLCYAWDRGHIRHWPVAFDAKGRHRPSRWGRWVVGHRPVLLFAGGNAVGSLGHRCQRRRTDDVRLTPTLKKTFPRNLMNCPQLRGQCGDPNFEILVFSSRAALAQPGADDSHWLDHGAPAMASGRARRWSGCEALVTRTGIACATLRFKQNLGGCNVNEKHFAQTETVELVRRPAYDR
jgi:hypothetical protein